MRCGMQLSCVISVFLISIFITSAVAQSRPRRHGHGSLTSHHQSDVEHHQSDVEHQHSDVEHRHSDVENRHSDVDHRHSDVDYHHSEVEHHHNQVEHHQSDLEPNPSDVEDIHDSGQYVDVIEDTTSDMNYSSTDETDEGRCSQCEYREQLKLARIEGIKKQILDKLRLERPPEVDSRLGLPNSPAIQNIREAFEMMGDSAGHDHDSVQYEEEDYYANNVRTFNMAAPPPPHLHINYSNAIYFDYSVEPGKRISHVELSVHVKPRIAMEQYTSIYIRYYKLAPPEVAGGSPVKRATRGWFREKKHTVPATGAWYTLDVRDWVREWTHTPATNLGLVVEAVDSLDDRQVVDMPNIHVFNRDYVPFLTIRLTDLHHHRQKREIQNFNCHEMSRDNRCCKFPLVVDFQAMGWDFILSPRMYNANYCSGECPFVFMQKYPNTHIVQQWRGDDGPCCNPTRMGEMSVLFFMDNDTLSLGTIPGMSVQQCGCS